MNVIDKYNARVDAANSLVCVGLDSDHRRLPERFAGSATPQFDFNRWVIDQTHEFASAYKPNIAFYEARGDTGLRDLKATIDYLHANHPDILTICDAKRADIGSTNEGYVEAIFDWLGFDAVTLLVPGIGAQGGEVERTVLAGLNSQRKGLIISSSRGIIFAENPGEEARKLRDQINQKR